MKAPSGETWIGWIGAMVVGVATTVAFAYGTFETKDHARERTDVVVQRLDRIESYAQRIDEKIDRILRDRR